MRIPLSLAWKVNERLRLGASLDVTSASVNLASLLDAQQVGALIQAGRATGSLVPLLAGVPDLSGAHFDFVRNDPINSELAAWGVAGRLGLSYQLDARTVMAAAYEFETALRDLKGDGQLTAVDKNNNHIVLAGKGSLPAFQFPQSFTIGISHRLKPTLALTADLRRTMWAQTLANTEVRFRTANGDDLRVVLPTGFNNMTTLTLGSEWQFKPQWTWRLGGSHSFQPTIPGNYLSGSFPTLSDNHVATNLSYTSSSRRHQFDAGLSVGFAAPVVRSKGGQVNSIPPIEGRNRQITPVVGYSYHF